MFGKKKKEKENEIIDLVDVVDDENEKEDVSKQENNRSSGDEEIDLDKELDELISKEASEDSGSVGEDLEGLDSILEELEKDEKDIQNPEDSIEEEKEEKKDSPKDSLAEEEKKKLKEQEKEQKEEKVENYRAISGIEPDELKKIFLDDENFIGLLFDKLKIKLEEHIEKVAVSKVIDLIKKEVEDLKKELLEEE